MSDYVFLVGDDYESNNKEYVSIDTDKGKLISISYEQQTEKFLKRRTDLEKRVLEDKAEIDKINAKLNEMQLARVRDTFR